MSCSGSGNTADEYPATPRQKAYPRPQLYDTIYTEAEGVPCNFTVNAMTVTTNKTANTAIKGNRAIWLDVEYPAYNAILRCTFTPANDEKTRNETVENRTERMALNLGDNAAEQTDVSSPYGFSAIVLTATGATITPVQFIAAGNRWVISGALEMPSAAISTDSVRPMIKAVEKDVIHALRHLKQ